MALKTDEPQAMDAHGVLHVHKASGEAIQEWSGSASGRTWTLFQGPAKEALSFVRGESVDCVVTSPPYFWLRDYGVGDQIGLEDSVDAYVVNLTDVMSEAYRVLKKDGVLFLNIGDTYYSGKGESQGIDQKSSKRRFGLRAVDKSGGLGIGLKKKSIIGIPWRVAMKMCQQNWILRAPIIWHRDKCLPESVKDRPRRGYEYIFMFVKARKYYFDREALPQNGGSEDVWRIPARPKNGSIDTAPFPDELVKQCLSVGCKEGGLVLDPFCGSGTTIRVALEMNRDAIGVEINPEFCNYAKQALGCDKLK
jgi:DNA modification methylase